MTKWRPRREDTQAGTDGCLKKNVIMSTKNVTESFLLEEPKELKLSLTTILTDQINKSISTLREDVIDKLIEENAKLQDRLKLMEERVQKLETDLADSN